MQDNEKKTALRFKGFTDPWEQRKLKELYFQLTERNADLLPYQKTLSVATMSFKTDGNGAADTSLANYKRLRTGDIAFEGHTSKEFRYGRFVLNDVGDGIMSPRFSALRPLHEMPINFWKYYIHYEPIMRKVLVNSTKAGTMMNELVINEFLQGSILVPSMAEQQAIGRFFKQLDTLITLHQRKYEKLVNIKKSMLDKMFPKNGASVPEIRFKGFTDPWEQRKLEEYLEVSGQKNFEGIYTKEDVLSVSGDFGIVNQIEFQGRSFAGASVANYGVVETGDIVYTKSPLKSNPYGIIKANKGKNGIVSTLYAVYKPKQSANPEFVQIYFEQDARMNNYMHPLVNKGAKNDMKVSAENALKGQIVFPDIKEQRTISEFFHNLDTLITLHQRKLEKLQNIKKSCLEKMFV